MNLNSRNKVNVQFSMSGMTDIVFLLLLFFMLTSTLIAPNALNLKLLLPQSNNQTGEKPITSVSISKDLKFYVDNTPVAFSDIETLLQKKLRAYRVKYKEDPVISLHTDKTVDIDYVVKIMNIARKNNYKLILATSPE